MAHYIHDDEKEGRKEALKHLMGVMGSMTGDKLKNLKAKPVAASISVEKLPDHEEPDGDEMDGVDDGDEPSEDEKAKIAELYHRYCK